MRNSTKRIVTAVVVLGLTVGAVGLARAQPAGTINVQFANGINREVIFFLNGGEGLETRLQPGQVQNYTMVVNQGVQPIVSIYQPNGGRRNFTVQNGGQYVFRYNNGGIENFYQ
jgi:hypothetical protein